VIIDARVLVVRAHSIEGSQGYVERLCSHECTPVAPEGVSRNRTRTAKSACGCDGFRRHFRLCRGEGTIGLTHGTSSVFSAVLRREARSRPGLHQAGHRVTQTAVTAFLTQSYARSKIASQAGRRRFDGKAKRRRRQAPSERSEPRGEPNPTSTAQVLPSRLTRSDERSAWLRALGCY
jgi:hypothetical protein